MTSDEAQKLFDEGTKLLSETKFAEARAKFVEVERGGSSSAGLQANLGRALVETGDLGFGISALEKAVGLERFNSQHREDLKFAQSKVESSWGLPMKHPAEWGALWSSYVRPSENFAAATFFFLLIFALFFLRRLKKQYKILLSFLTIVFCALGVLGIYSRSLGTLVKDSELRSAPLESAEVTQNLKSGVRLRVVRFSGDFAEIERTGAFRGWIKAENLKKSPF